MKIAVSFTSFMRDAFEDPALLKAIEAFAFGCTHEHVIRDDGKVPFELTFLNKSRASGGKGFPERSSDDTEISVACLGEDVQAFWYAFYEKIYALDGVHRVMWRCNDRPIPTKDGIRQPRNYRDFVNILLELGHEVWYEHDWLIPSGQPLANA